MANTACCTDEKLARFATGCVSIEGQWQIVCSLVGETCRPHYITVSTPIQLYTFFNLEIGNCT